MLMIAAAKLIIAVAKLIFLYSFSCFHLLPYIYIITYLGYEVKQKPQFPFDFIVLFSILIK